MIFLAHAIPTLPLDESMSFSLICRLVNVVARTRRSFHVATVPVAFAGTFLLSGCGQSEPTVVEAKQAPPAPAVTSQADAAAAEQVVGQFLDRIRRGGGMNDASELLSDRARTELERIGTPIQPIGSPDATFTITRSEAIPADPSDGPDALPHRLVHCIWSEPLPAGAETGEGQSTQNFQVVWAVVRQPSGWRISGMVLETTPGEPPVVLDFENGELMAQVLNNDQQSQSTDQPGAETIPTARAATLPGPGGPDAR